jgi:hypothetical protein
MRSPASNVRRHPDNRICELLESCPFLIDRVDLSEGPHYIVSQVAMAIRDNALSSEEVACVFSHLNRMASADEETKNLLVVSMLELLADTPDAVDRTRKGLSGGAARFLFERVLNGWID